MSTIKDGGPAFPVRSAAEYQAHGMSLLDHFAGLAMQELLRHALAMVREGRSGAAAAVEEIPFHAFDMSAAMLIERARRQA